MLKVNSLRGQLMLYLGVPMALLWALSVWSHYHSAKAAATQAYDRTLLASARTVAERLTVRNGQLAVDVPWVVLDSFERNMNDQLYYQILTPQGNTLSGYDDLPPLPRTIPLSRHYPALAHFYDAHYHGRAIRVVALWQPVNESGVEGMVLILVAETLRSREAFAHQQWLIALISQSALVLLALLLVLLLFRKLLRPLRQLSGVMARREPGDLTPLPPLLPWSEMQPLLVAFNRYMARLRGVLQRQERFGADAAHQLRTPLAVLKTQVGVALNSPQPAQWRDSLTGMRATLDDTIQLTDRLLQLSRLRAQDSKEHIWQTVDLAELVRDACFSRLPQARSRQIDLGYEGDEHCLIRGEPLLLAELCANLLDNALKYTPQGGVVTARVQAQQLEIDDSGPGIPTAERAQAMRPFHRLDSHHGLPGAGLGLALVRDIALWHHARLQLLDCPSLGGLRVRIAFGEAAS
ncbi:integral membrane sensor signal transduction histidine kinase [Dickeya parazeae Ech586]|uniref:histidine kinase n=1 Tax=Dickeya zeae (strain Ech586) TaxID=590409 RepID=D2BS69_DICZ5|nr:sensor histidine kinase [Dickeya parazeae]ACZ77616.1 integral membrane sensor signal transduction histidine kinase [Dickeya parazeae Ech586]